MCVTTTQYTKTLCHEYTHSLHNLPTGELKEWAKLYISSFKSKIALRACTCKIDSAKTVNLALPAFQPVPCNIISLPGTWLVLATSASSLSMRITMTKKVSCDMSMKKEWERTPRLHWNWEVYSIFYMYTVWAMSCTHVIKRSCYV